MNKVANAAILKKALYDFLRGVQGQKDANIHRIKELIQISTIDKPMALALYYFAARDANNKLDSVVRLLDKKLMEHQPYPFQKERSERFNLSLHVYRLITLAKYRLPYEQTVQLILEHILIDELANADIFVLLKLLEQQPIYYSKSYFRLAANILDLLHQHLLRHPPTSSFISSVSKSLARSAFRIPSALNKTVNEAIDRNLPFLTFPQITQLSHQMREKSLEQWKQLGNLETSMIRKRIIYQYILNKQYPGLQYRNFLPGKQWKNAEELQQAVKCVRSLGVKQPYIDIFPTIDTPYTNPAEGYASLQSPQFVNQFIEHIFTYIKNNYSRIDYYSAFKIVRTLRSLFSPNAATEPNLQYFQAEFKKSNLNLLNLLVIIYELGRYPVDEPAELQKVTKKMLQIVLQTTSIDYLQHFNYKNYKPQQFMLVYGFIYSAIVDHLVQKHSNSSLFKKIEVFLNNQKERKHEASEFSKLLAFFRFSNATLQKEGSFGSQKDILLQEEIDIHQIRQLLEPYLETNQEENNKIDNLLSSFCKKYKTVQNVLIQPNLRVKYAIIEKQSSKIVGVIESKQNMHDKMTYEIVQPHFEQNIKIIKQDTDLTTQSVWKMKFFKYYYKCQYLYCQNELELPYKLHNLIKKLEKQ